MTSKNTKDFVILAQGNPVSASFVKKFLKKYFLIALDGAANHLQKIHIKPDLIMGDMDSIHPKTYRYFHKQKVPFFYAPDQNFSDLEKALLFCQNNGARSNKILNSQGSRMDHSLAAFIFLKKYHSSIPLSLVNESSEAFYLQSGSYTFSKKIGSGFALLPFPKAIISSSGLKYNMNKQTLNLGVKESISNSFTAKKCKIKITGNAIVIMTAPLQRN